MLNFISKPAVLYNCFVLVSQKFFLDIQTPRYLYESTFLSDSAFLFQMYKFSFFSGNSKVPLIEKYSRASICFLSPSALVERRIMSPECLPAEHLPDS